MKFVKPTPITDSLFVSSTKAETDYTAWSATTIYAAGDWCMLTTGYHRVYQALIGKKSTVTMTIASPCVVSWTAHGLTDGTAIVFTTTGALPTGLTAGTTYYVKSPATDTFNVALTSGGAAINTSGTQSGTHTCGLASNYNKAPNSNSLTWLDSGPTGRWAMFDGTVGTVTSQATPLTVVVNPGAIDTVALLDLSGSSVQVTLTNGGSTVFDQTVTLVDTYPLFDWYGYFFSPIVTQSSLIITGIPPYPAGQLTVTVNAAVTASCGTFVAGTLIDIGGTSAGASLGIIDYSGKATDVFGVTSVTQRAYAKRFDINVIVDNGKLDYLSLQLASVRATPCIWVADETKSSLIVYGYYKDWDIAISYPTISEIHLTIEGLI